MNEQVLDISKLTSEQLKEVILAGYSEIGQVEVQLHQKKQQLLELNQLYGVKKSQEEAGQKEQVLNLPKLKKLNIPKLPQQEPEKKEEYVFPVVNQ